MALPIVQGVDPLIPDAQKNKSPEILLEGFRTGFAAAANIAQQRRQTESDMARMALQERMQSEAHDLEQQRINIASELMPAQKKLAEAHADYYKNYQTTRGRLAMDDLSYNQSEERLMNDANNQARKLQLLDPALPTRNPVAFADSALQFKAMYEHSDKPWLKHAVDSFMRTAEGQKVTIKRTTRDPASGEWTEYGDPIQVPYYQVVLKLKDPAKREEALKELEGGGHIGERSVTKKRPMKGWWDEWVGNQEEYTEKEKFQSPEAKTLIEGAETYSFEKPPSRVDAASLPRPARKGTDAPVFPFEKGGLNYQSESSPPPDTTTDPTEGDQLPDQSRAGRAAAPMDNGGYFETETDKILGQAMRALRMGAEPKLVAARMQEHGVDPSTLWA